MSDQFTIGNLYVAWGHRDGLHLIGPRRHFHVFLWTRGHRRNPIYMRWLPGSRRPT